MQMSTFVDEYLKIAASSSKSKNPKTRIGRRPIRVDNLLKKADAKVKAGKGLLNLLAKNKKTLGLLGAGALGAKGIEEYAIEPLEYGYQVMRARGEL